VRNACVVRWHSPVLVYILLVFESETETMQPVSICDKIKSELVAIKDQALVQ
jgi:hypothetical protein